MAEGDINRLLLQYLREDREDRSQMRSDLAKIATSLEHVVDRLQRLEEKEETSKVHQIADLKKQLEEKERYDQKASDFWKHSAVKWAAAAIAWTFSLAITTAATWLLTRK